MNTLMVEIPGLLKTLRKRSLSTFFAVAVILPMLMFVQPGYAAMLPAYPNARIELSVDERRQNHPVITSRMKRINGVVTSDGARWLDGDLRRRLYFLPPGHSSYQGYEFYANLLRGQGVETLFECRSFSCGASNFWANDIFEIPTLYGQDKEQAFYIGKALGSYYMVYSVRRGNGRIYTLVDAFNPYEDKIKPLGEQRTMWLAMDTRNLDKNAELTSFAADMVGDPAMNALLIIHGTAPGTLAELDAWQAQVKIVNQRILTYLKEQGISESRLRFNISIGRHDDSLDQTGKHSVLLEIVPIS